jgi:muramidase (phage lysozyme)
MPITDESKLPGGLNMAAFLDMLAWSEGTSTNPATACDGYDVIVTGRDGRAEIFSDFSAHPFANGRSSKVINSRGLTSNASGRYQFMLRDYKHYKTLLKLPDFGPLSQDKWAVQLIKERGAIPDIGVGNLRKAITRCSNIWASLPGAGYGQPEHKFEALRAQYLLNGGVDNGVS